MHLSEDDIRELLSEIAARNPRNLAEKAIETLYGEFSLTLRQYLSKNWVQDFWRIDDIIQDTFLEVWKYPERFRGDSLFKTWLIGVARHKAVDAFRKEHSNHEPLDEVEEYLVADIPEAIDTIQEEQIRASLKLCLESLSESGKLSSVHREVLYLAYVEDQDISEMAKIFGCPESTVKTRLHYARLRVKKCMQQRLKGALAHE